MKMQETNTMFLVWRQTRSKTPFWICHNLNPDFRENHCRTLRTMGLVQAWPPCDFTAWIVLKFDLICLQLAEQDTSIFFQSANVGFFFFTGVKPPPQKKAKLSETDARYEKEKRKREPQKTWKDKRPLVGWMFFWVVHLNVWVFLSGNQGFIRATKFMALVAQLLK